MSAQRAPRAESDLVAQARRSGIHVFGAGGFARSVAAAARARGIRVHSLLVSGDPGEREWDGIPIRRVDAEALQPAPTWIGVFNREAHSDYSALRGQLGRHAVRMPLVWPQAYYQHLQESLGWRFWLHDLDDYAEQRQDISAARALLEDDASRQAFDRILEFRRLTDPHWISPQPCADTQYLPAWLQERIAAPLRIVDAGAYRGETLLEIAGLLDVQQAWTFEPDPANYTGLVQNLAGLPIQVTNIPAGLAERSSTAAFAAGQGESGNFSPGAGSTATIVALDECLHGAPVNFLKLDVEGHELAALAGAARTLRRERPILAVAGYHRWDDLWRIPLFIAALQLDYRLRLALHAHNTFDSVFYAY